MFYRNSNENTESDFDQQINENRDQHKNTSTDYNCDMPFEPYSMMNDDPPMGMNFQNRPPRRPFPFPPNVHFIIHHHHHFHHFPPHRPRPYRGYEVDEEYDGYDNMY